MLDPIFTPFPEIKTQRLLLRKVAITDAPEMLSLRSDEMVMQYINKEKTKSMEEATAFIQKLLDALAANENIFWAITLADDPQIMIGNISYWRLQKEHYRAEVGYTLHPRHWNKGIMTEALLSVIKYGFTEMKLHSIEAHINPANLASAAVLEKTGFKREGYFKENFCFRGNFSDTAVYSLLAP